MTSRRIAFAASGTGGHVAPAVGLSQELQRRGWDCVFLTGDREVERKFVLPGDWGELIYCPSPPLPGSNLKWFGFARSMIGAVSAAKKILRERDIALVVAFGGYGCVAPSIAARRLGIPVFLLEQNVYPGRAARLISRWAVRAFTHWEKASALLAHPERAMPLGTPLRPGLLEGTRAGGVADCGLSADLKTIVVLGGSQGAHGLNVAVTEAIKTLGNYTDQMQFVHQTGDDDCEWVRKAHEDAGTRACVRPFFDNMPNIFRLADLVVSRAGGSTIAEVSAFGLPSVLVPYPHASEGHQLKNASEQAEVGAATLFEEEGLLPGMLAETWIGVVEESAWTGTMSRSAVRTSRPDAAMAVAKEIEKTMKEQEEDNR